MAPEDWAKFQEQSLTAYVLIIEGRKSDSPQVPVKLECVQKEQKPKK
jgi:hypothetical protein